MTLIIELTPEVESRLEQEATRQGIEPQDFARKLIEKDLPPKATSPQTAPVEPTLGAKLLVELEREGAIGIWQDRTEDSAELAREWRKQAEARGYPPDVQRATLPRDSEIDDQSALHQNALMDGNVRNMKRP